ncbi:hypothetical protein AGMMS50230_04670 [Spirochaetia bacterium]|nr:hypothetical protein AGMMS50230_04670 [Spirochaetia bacterium]
MVNMCPDSQILSVYFDGELDSPWKEKCEKHLEACPSCRKHLESYRLTRQRLFAVSPDLGKMEDSMNRVWEKTSFAAEKPRWAARFWIRSVTIPLPAAAAAGIIMALALAALITLRPVKTTDPQLAGLEVQDMIPVSDMANLFQYLGSENSPDMVIIRLPDTTFKNAGEPQMLRAADYSRSGTSR